MYKNPSPNVLTQFWVIFSDMNSREYIFLFRKKRGPRGIEINLIQWLFHFHLFGIYHAALLVPLVNIFFWGRPISKTVYIP